MSIGTAPGRVVRADGMSDEDLTTAEREARQSALAAVIAQPAGRIDQREAQLLALAQALVDIDATGSGSPVHCLAGIDQEMAAQLLLSLEVLEQTFGTFASHTEQPVEVIRIDSIALSPVDPLHRSLAAGKVAGVQLGHFGSFLKASWRANDWLWGRLDGAGDIVDVLLTGGDEESIKRSERMTQLGVLLAAPAAPPDAATSLKERLGAEIARDEAPTIVDALDQDAADKARDTPSARAIRAVVKGMAPSPGPRAKDIRFAKALLTANRLGEETVGEEAGSDLLTLVSVQALATGTTVLRAESPRIFRKPIAVLRFVSLLAWALLQGRLGGAAGRAVAGALFGAGLAITLVDFTTDASLGPVGPIGVAMFAAGVLLGFTRNPTLMALVLAFAVLPSAVFALPDRRWKLYPDGWWWPQPGLDRHDWVAPLCFVVGGVLIGSLPMRGGRARRRRRRSSS